MPWFLEEKQRVAWIMDSTYYAEEQTKLVVKRELWCDVFLCLNLKEVLFCPTRMFVAVLRVKWCQVFAASSTSFGQTLTPEASSTCFSWCFPFFRLFDDKKLGIWDSLDRPSGTCTMSRAESPAQAVRSVRPTPTFRTRDGTG